MKTKKMNKDVYVYNNLKRDLQMNENEIFEYITESYINGQKKQCYNLFSELSYVARDKYIRHTNNLSIVKFLLCTEVYNNENHDLTIETIIDNK